MERTARTDLSRDALTSASQRITSVIVPKIFDCRHIVVNYSERRLGRLRAEINCSSVCVVGHPVGGETRSLRMKRKIGAADKCR
jgi:hypothetical protein